MTLAVLTQRIKAQAHRLGFDLVGVTDCAPPASYPHYEAWLAAGYHAGMAYMARQRNRERRADPRRILPECQSIVVLAVRYFAPPPLPAAWGRHTPADGSPSSGAAPPGEIRKKDNPTASLTGRVAAYAWGADYHDVLVERLQALVAFIEEQVGHPVPHRLYTDTGPVLERDLAQRAGLGWIGKNAMLIHPRLGSYLLLAEILLGLPLEADAPFPTDHCGSCTRCLEACPTQAIRPGRTVDANRCLSYLTIEHRGPTPETLRPGMGDWVFGCDVCQQVCPWNRRAPQAGDAAFAPRPDVPRPDLLADLQLTPEAFSRKFRGSPVKRAKRRGYLRNIAVALGNLADPEAVPALRQALQDPEPLVRGHAAWALGRIGTSQARAALEAALPVEDDPEVQAELRRALAAHRE